MFIFFVGITFYSCEQATIFEESIPNNSENEYKFVEPSEEIINGELFIDGVSQQEDITDVEIKGVKVIDGRLAFEDHNALMNAIDRIGEYNTESIVAWSEKMGFTSLFTELTRMEEFPVERIEEELYNKDLLNSYFYITDERVLALKKHTVLMSRIFNAQGLVQVGDFVGTISPGLNVWVEADKTDKLIQALKNAEIPENDNDFLIEDKRAFSMDRDFFLNENCAKNSTWISLTSQFKNPNANRRIDVTNSFWEIKTPLNLPGTWSVDALYKIETVSRKSASNKYKTNHYLSIDVITRLLLFGNIPQSSVRYTKTETDTKTKYGFISRDVFSGFAGNDVNGEIQLIQALPGSSGQQGTSASHRGMGGHYARQSCN